MNSSTPSQPEPENNKISSKSIFEEWLNQKSFVLLERDMINGMFSRHSIHQGHVMLATSLAFGILAYRDYHRPLDDIIQKALLKTATTSRHHDAMKNNNIIHQQPTPPLSLLNIESASDDLRRAIGSITAVRALRVATIATVSVFCFTGAVSLYATKCTTFSDFFILTRKWAIAKRQTLDEMLGVDQSMHRDLHPDIAATRGMSEEQELDYVYKTYFPQDEMQEPDVEQKDSK